MSEKLDEYNLRINLQKCHFAKTETEWHGYKFTQAGIPPLENKVAAILAIQPPSTLKRLRSLLGSAHYISKFIPRLAHVCHPLRPLLKTLLNSFGLRNTLNISILKRTKLQQVQKTAIINLN